MRLFLLPILLMLCSFLEGNEVIERMGVKGPLRFDSTYFEISWSDRPRDNYYIQEYLPHGEGTETYNQMLTLHLFVTDLSAEETVGQKVLELEKRKETDKVCHYMVAKSPDGEEYIVDFLLGASKNEMMSIVEFNLYRYRSILVGDKKAILAFAYTKRAYGDDITPFLKNLSEIRSASMHTMIKMEMPAIVLHEVKN